MNAEFKAQWVDALRSGEYQQTISQLRDDGGFCCLGVARELIAPNSRAKLQREELLYYRHSKLMGLAIEQQRALSEMNDSGWTFDQIAGYIEAEL